MSSWKKIASALVWLWSGVYVVHAATPAEPTERTATSAATAKVEIFGEPFVPLQLTGKAQRRLIFYRAADDQASAKGVATILVNEQYHASLRPGSFSKLCADQDSYEMAAVARGKGLASKASTDPELGVRTQLKPQQTRYFRAQVNHGGGQTLSEVEELQALTQLAQTREAIHTLSRVSVAQTCEEAAAPSQSGQPPVANAPAPSAAAQPVASPKAVQRLSISAETLFAFGMADRASMPAQGLRALDDLKTKVQNKGITRIRVIGYADPIGQAVSNLRLSQKRAQEIKSYLQSIGLNTVSIEAEGRGATELVATHCSNEATPEAIECHQPNRRVVIELTGAQE